jgi:hypothetical protein
MALTAISIERGNGILLNGFAESQTEYELDLIRCTELQQIFTRYRREESLYCSKLEKRKKKDSPKQPYYLPVHSHLLGGAIKKPALEF